MAFLVLTLLALLAANLGATFAKPSPQPGLPSWLAPWVRYDSGWYYRIATEGYFYDPSRQSAVAFFPTYPLLMRLGGAVLGVYLAGVIITVLAGLSSVLLFTRWCAGRLTRRATLVAVALLLLYPYSVFLYGAVYADALFLACAIGAFLLLERGHPVLAGLVGALASAGRPLGVAVVVGLAVRAVERADQRARAGRQPRPPAAAPADEPTTWKEKVSQGGGEALTATRRALRSVGWADAGVLLSAAGLGGYMVFQWVAFRQPFAFWATESSPGWDQGSGPRVWFKVAFFGQMLRGNGPEVLRLLIPALLCLAVVLLLPRVQRRFGWGYAIYTGIAVAIPVLGTKDFMGSGRYLLAAFPAVAVVAEIVEQWSRAARTALLTGSGVLLLAAAAGYGQGFQVS